MMMTNPTDEYTDMSTDESPVTQTAETDVNSASIYGTGTPDEYANGIDNNKEPTTDIRIKYENI
jgi:hypothetical protein